VAHEQVAFDCTTTRLVPLSTTCFGTLCYKCCDLFSEETEFLTQNPPFVTASVLNPAEDAHRKAVKGQLELLVRGDFCLREAKGRIFIAISCSLFPASRNTHVAQMTCTWLPCAAPPNAEDSALCLWSRNHFWIVHMSMSPYL
jgi:hypothetical protein